MGFWKVLGYAVLGAGGVVGAVVALPIAGPIGAITAVGAAVAGTAGGVAGAVVGGVSSSIREDEIAAARQEGRRAAEAISRDKEEKYKKATEGYLARAESHEQWEKRLRELVAIGFSAAACDGAVSSDEREALEAFLLGVKGSETVSPFTKQSIEEMAANPPSFNAAMALLPSLTGVDLEVVDELIELVIREDGIEHENEMAFRQAWHEKRAAMVVA